MKQHVVRIISAVALGVAAQSAWAVLPPATSLNNCQNAVKVATAAFVKTKVAAIGGCLQAVSTQIVKNNAATASGAASSCVTQFRKLNDSRGLNKQLSDKLAVAITKKCAPGQPGVTHTLADIIGAGAGVPQPLKADNLNAWCSAYGGDGTIDSLQEWIDCLSAAAECDVDSTIASQYPRAIEWLNAVKPSMQGLAPPGTDPNKIIDAVAGLDAVKAEIDGPDNDNAVSIQCGGGGGVLSTCGDGVKNGSDACDGSDLGGQTCSGLGYASGTLSCAPTCVLNVSGCATGSLRLSKTGQTSSYGTGSDGAVQAGAALSYTDNGDGTITDNTTGLMWEKKDDSAGIHGQNNLYTWGMTSPPYTMNGTMVTTFLATLNAGGGFAGHTDWRIPNITELTSILNLEVFGPAVSPAFHNAAACTACSDVTLASCSCTLSDWYWSSTTNQKYPAQAWIVHFHYPFVRNGGFKNLGGGSVPRAARAVRGGL